jgi:molecular chaperone DnaK
VVFTRLIERNTTIPTRKSEVFSTASDSQPSVEIHVLQGEREMAGGNKTIGRFHLEEIPAAPRGVPQIEVTFDIDANGILNVSAKDLGTGREQKITITGSSGLKEDDIKKMVQDAQAHAEDDKKQKQTVETKNRANSMVYQTERQLREQGDKVPAALRQPIEDGVANLKKAIDSDDTERMSAVMKELEGQLHRFAEELYRNVQAPGAAGPGGSQGGAPGGGGPAGESEPHASSAQDGGRRQKQADDDGVIDADFRMVNDDDKGKK